MNNIHERRLVALRSHVPGEVMFMLIGVAVVAMGITGFYGGLTRGWRVATAIMSIMLGVVLMIVVDLDRPTSGLIKVPFQALVDVAQAIAP
jgi:hypothetical protein